MSLMWPFLSSVGRGVFKRHRLLFKSRRSVRLSLMIILHDPKIIFLKARKVAGTSLEIALSKYADDRSIITPVGEDDELLRKQLGFRGPQKHMYSIKERLKFPKKEIVPALIKRSRRRKFTQHMSAKDVRARVGESVWSSYTKISVIRDPLDYFISYYCWQHHRVPRQEWPDFCDWCRTNIDIYALNNEQYFIDGEIVIDHFLRFERLSQDLLDFENMFPWFRGLSETLKGIRAKGGARKTSDTPASWFQACPDVLDLIYKRYAATIEMFDLEFPNLRVSSPP